MGGLGITHPDKTKKDFQQNLIKRIYNQSRANPIASHRSIHTSRPSERSKQTHTGGPCAEVGTQRMATYCQPTQPWNMLIGLAFHAVADLLAAYEASRDSWHTAAINGHSHFSKIFPLSVPEDDLRQRRT
jgi:hypothetical protein